MMLATQDLILLLLSLVLPLTFLRSNQFTIQMVIQLEGGGRENRRGEISITIHLHFIEQNTKSSGPKSRTLK